jgi:hypothetical protein
MAMVDGLLAMVMVMLTVVGVSEFREGGQRAEQYDVSTVEVGSSRSSSSSSSSSNNSDI